MAILQQPLRLPANSPSQYCPCQSPGTAQWIEIENGQLIFYDWKELESTQPTITLDRSNIKNIRITDSATTTFKKAEISYQDAKKKELIIEVAAADGSVLNTRPKPNQPKPKKGQPKPKEEVELASPDVLKVESRCENRQQAIEKAKESLRKANGSQVTAQVSIEGRADILAGVNITLKQFGKLSGKYMVEETTHHLTKMSGWATDCKLRKL